MRYQGSFTSTGSTNPNGGTGLSDGVDGTFEGGYRLVFAAAESFNAPTRGHLETVVESTASKDWMQSYFTSVSPGNPTPEWWGWVYHGGHNGTWVNAISGTQGNITSNP